MPLYKPKTNKEKFKFDKTIVIITTILILFGLIMLFSASAAVGLEFGDSSYFVKRQLIAVILGVILFFIAQKIDYHFWQKWSLWFFLGAIFLLIMLFVPGLGISGKGAQRWLDVGPFTFQPSEFAKLALVIYLSAWISEKGAHLIRDFKAGLIPFVGILSVLFLLILKQPDLGTFAVICVIGLTLYFVGGANLKHFASLIVAGLIMFGIAIKIAPYRLQRFSAFLNPELDPLGAGYHVQQAILAIGSGGLLGVGLGHSRQKFFYLPEVVGDSLFAVIGEELGFIFSAGLVILFLIFFKHGLNISSKAPDKFGQLVSIGIIFWLTFQAFINIGAMLGILPLTGIPLPLMSFGGSAMLINLFALGILMNISKQSNI